MQKACKVLDISPNRVRIQEISEKMQTINAVQNEDKQTKIEQYEFKIKSIEEKMQRATAGEESKFKASHSTLSKTVI